MLSTDYDEPVDYIDDFLRIVALVKATKPRDPFAAMVDALLDLRAGL